MRHVHHSCPSAFNAGKRARFLVDRPKRLKGGKRVSSRESSMSQTMTTYLQDDYSSIALKALSSIKGLFETQTRRDAVVDREPGTVDKAVLVEISSGMLGTGHEPAAAMLDTHQVVIHECMTLLLEQPDLQTAVIRLRDATTPVRGKMLFSVSDTTMERVTPSMDRTQLDGAIRGNYAECMAEFGALGVQSKDVFVANDDTSFGCRSASPNGWFKAARIGGRAKWEQALSFSVREDVTHMLFAGCMPLAGWLDAAQAPGQEPWLQEIADCIAEIKETGGHVVAAGLDRGFFQPVGFAIAGSSGLAKNDDGAENVLDTRLVMPWKFGPNKADLKWEYLTDDTKAQVIVETLKVDVDKHPGVAGTNNGVVETTPDCATTVKVARVALVDEYGGDEKRSLDELRAEAKDVDAEMQATTRDLEEKEQAYVDYRTAAGKKDAKKPSYGRGKKREKFDDAEDEALYKACLDLHEKSLRLGTRKERILASLVFFAISIFPGEDVVTMVKTFIELARDYHARWLIEIGFKVVKESFCRDIRSCKPTARQFVLVMGMVLHNWWRVVRMEQAVAWLQAHGKPIEFWKVGRRWIRLPIERQIPGLVSSVAFTSRILTEGMMNIVRETIRGAN
jgi:hypothetical protein